MEGEARAEPRTEGIRRRAQERDTELGRAVERAQQGDEAAFTTAYRIVHPPLLNFLRGLVGDDAEDVASDAWLEIARDIGRFRGDGAGFRAWTAQIARHRAVDHLRRVGSRPRGSLLEVDLTGLPSRQDTEQEVLETVSTRAALALIARLPRRQAEAVLLQTVIGLDGPAAARVLGTRQGAVRSAAHRVCDGWRGARGAAGRGSVTDSDRRALGGAR
ncbi:RNA polymerase sigma factor [Streptomyces zhihengii]